MAVNLVCRVCFRMRVRGRPRLRGGYVLVSNHVSLIDPIVLGAALPRRIRYFMTELYYRDPRAQWFYRFTRAIPVFLHGHNRNAMRTARDALAAGEVVGVFPEGGISRDGRPYLGNPGAVSLVLSANVPVVPVALIGLHRASPGEGGGPRRAKVTVRFGQPIAPADLAGAASGRKERLAHATRRIMEEIAALAGTVSRETELERLRQPALE